MAQAPDVPRLAGPPTDPRVASLEAEVAAVRALFHDEVLSSAERVARLEVLLNEQREEVVRLAGERRRLELIIADLSAAHDAELGRLMSDSSEEVEAARSAAQSLASELRTARRELIATRQYVGSLLVAEQRLLSDAHAAGLAVSGLTHELTDTRSQLRETQSVLSNAQFDADARAERMSLEVATAEERIAHLEATIADLTTSRSWRVTRPLRWLMYRLRGGRARPATPR